LGVDGVEVDTGHWQGVPTEGHPDLVTKELLDWDFVCPLPVQSNGTVNIVDLQEQVRPNLPWADDHFEERVSRVPSNTGEQYQNWPWWQGGYTEAKSMIPSQQEGGEFKFTHTYQERIWPKLVNGSPWQCEQPIAHGIHYEYGDLDDVVNLLLREPYTRQAYLPIYFPEDTGSVHGGRTPCTIGYHFMLRGDELHMWYTIRSCDAVRHFRDDVYLALRLQLWVLEALRTKEKYEFDHPEVWSSVRPGNFYFKAFSFHVHMGDIHRV